MPSASYDDAFRILQAATAAEQNGMYEEVRDISCASMLLNAQNLRYHYYY
jgi:hypothetical protein